ncbi:MAG: FadD3 family acyl-CoA ligase [Acidimicrobiales bacterium]|jgi:acyl-CoA synthetase (AMP-forming)/AMP-acid ligase II|nr:FadD3 family acyl-CoA ligase [Acidimicrobiales bacterium]
MSETPLDEGTRGDLRWGTTPRLVRDVGERLRDVPAVVEADLTLTYGELATRVRDAARAMMAAGLQPGDVAAVWAPNIHEWIVAALGLHAAGGTLVPLNTRFKGNEAGYVLERSGARLLFAVTDFLDADYVALLRAARGGPADGRPVSGLARLERIVVLRGAVPDGAQSWSEFLDGASAVSEADADARAEAVHPDDLSDMLFTSGTTGNPKGVMTTHGQNLRAFLDWATVVGLRQGDRYLIINPFFHAFGYKAGILASLMTGATIYPQTVLDVPTVMHRVAEERITMLPGTPTLYQTIIHHPDFGSTDLSSLRLAVTGAAAIPVELVVQMREVLGFETVITGYGLTEACGIATMCRYDDDPETIATTSGRAIPGVEVRCIDEAGDPVPAGEAGEVVLRGYNVMKGYLDDPEQTAETIDADGWLHTGDVGVLDERGYIRITDRVKDMFIVGGFNAYPAEIENLMLADDRIAQVAVVGVPDPRLGEVGMAFVLLRPGQQATEAEIIAWCRENMANYKVPRHVRFVDALPLNATGKVLKYELRDRGKAELDRS